MRGFDEWNVPSRPETFAQLTERIAVLQRRVALLEEQAGDSLDLETFHHLTGFRDRAQALEEYERAGGDRVFSQVERHRTFPDPDAIHAAYEQMQQQFPNAHGALERALHVVASRRAFGPEEKQRTAAHKVVDDFHLFLLVFMYVHGGVLQFMAPFLPGIKVSQSQFSRLLDNATPVVARSWASKYYCVRPLDWLLAHASPAAKPHTRDENRRVPDENLRRADIVLCIDGYSVVCEKSGGTSEQKEIYDWSKSKEPVMRILDVCTLSGVIVELSSATGGRTSETTVAIGLGLADRIEEEAAARGRTVRLHFVLDRGFYYFKADLEKRQWAHVEVTFSIPFHLVKPGRKSAAEVEAGMRKQHPGEEVEWNRTVAEERWINEASVGGINHARFFHRMLDLTTLHLIDDFLAIAAAQVNKRLNVAPV
jgi:hypothetical protein